jgi:integrase
MTPGTHRKLTEKEYFALLKAAIKLPQDATGFQIRKHLRDQVLIRMLYETSMSVGDLLDVRVKDVDLFSYSIFVNDPRIWARTAKIVINDEFGFVYYSEATRHILIQYLEGRRKGYLIMNNRKERMSVRTAERIMDEYARVAGIQRIRGYTSDKDGKRRALKVVTCRALCEAGRDVEVPPAL